MKSTDIHYYYHAKCNFFVASILIFGLPCTLGSSSRNLGSEVKVSDADESA